VRCDHPSDEETEALFARVRRDHARLDVLVNSAWGGYERMVEPGAFTWPAPFWEQPLWRWDAMFDGGVRAAYAAARAAAPLMIEQGRGLIVHLSHWAAQKYVANVAYVVRSTRPEPRYVSSRCTVSGEKAGRQTATYSAPPGSGVL
jgi:NAD(P)-dependent dehydrogenase (short-subunit alcohol dehydrogenase family)